MSITTSPLPDHLAKPSEIGEEISVTGKWSPLSASGMFGMSEDSMEMQRLWQSIQSRAEDDESVLSASINQGVGHDAILIHQVFKDSESLIRFYSSVIVSELNDLQKVAKPELHLARGISGSRQIVDVFQRQEIPHALGNHIYSYVKEAHKQPDPATAIQVTAKWTCKPGDSENMTALKHWWQLVGTDAYSMEEGLLRFEVFEVAGEDALVIHETFSDTKELLFHLSKGTAEKYKKDIDQVAVPENYYFRGPVSWIIRTYSKFMRLPATYSNGGSFYTRPGGSMSDGLS